MSDKTALPHSRFGNRLRSLRNFRRMAEERKERVDARGLNRAAILKAYGTASDQQEYKRIK